MKTRTVGLITVGQVLGRAGQESAPYLDQQFPNGLMGQPMSTVGKLAVGGGLMALAIQKGKKKMISAPDTQLVAAVAGTRLFADELMDILKGYLAPVPGARLGGRAAVRARAAPMVRARAAAPMTGYSGGGLVRVD